MSKEDIEKEQVAENDEITTKRETFWSIFSILSAIIYSVFIFVGLDYTGSKTFAVVLICFEVAYVISLVFVIVLSKDKSKRALRLKNYKSAVKLLKAFSTIVCLVLSISVIINSATSFEWSNFLDVCYKLFMILFSLISVAFSVWSIIFRNKIEQTKSLLKEKLKENWQDSKIKR